MLPNSDGRIVFPFDFNARPVPGAIITDNMMRPILSLTLGCLLFSVHACNQTREKTADEKVAAALKEARASDVPPLPALETPTFSLGGSCHEPSPFRSFAWTFKQLDELREAGNWDALVEGWKQNVRNSCSNPYLWEQLFNALLNADRYDEAIQVMSQMSVRGFPLPHALLSRADPAFLNSTEFKGSAAGAQYEARDAEIRDMMRRAEQYLASMPGQELPPTPYRNLEGCPYGCCTRKWKTNRTVQLRESIESPTIVAEIPANVAVLLVTGEVRAEPEPYVILQDVGRLKAGGIVFFFDYIGEGTVNYWYQGKLNPELGLPEEYSGLSTYTDKICHASVVKGRCSLRQLQPEKKFLNEWWVRLRTPDGTEGWVLNTGQVSNAEPCG